PPAVRLRCAAGAPHPAPDERRRGARAGVPVGRLPAPHPSAQLPARPGVVRSRDPGQPHAGGTAHARHGVALLLPVGAVSALLPSVARARAHRERGDVRSGHGVEADPTAAAPAVHRYPARVGGEVRGLAQRRRRLAAEPPGGAVTPADAAVTSNERQSHLLARNVALDYVAIGVDLLLGAVMLPFNVAHLGPAAYGLFVLTTSITTYFSMLDLGYGSA